MIYEDLSVAHAVTTQNRVPHEDRSTLRYSIVALYGLLSVAVRGGAVFRSEQYETASSRLE